MPVDHQNLQWSLITLTALLFIASQLMVAATTTTTVSTKQNEATKEDDKLKLGIYVESLCPDSSRFFVYQLQPTFAAVGQIMDPTIVPFGKARVLGDNKMVCQHGSAECEGNRRMACILARAKNQSESIETISCIFSRTETPRDCIAKYMPGADFNDIEICKSSAESYKMMVEAEKQTGPISYVPKLTYNGEHTEEIQNDMESDLKEFVCRKYKGTNKPQACTTTTSTTPTAQSPDFSDG